MSRDTRSICSVWKSTWLRFGVTIICTAPSDGRIRASSFSVRAGMRISPCTVSSPGSGVERTASRKASAAANVTCSFPTCTSTPVKTGRDSSSEAAITTSSIISLSVAASSITGGSPPSALGIKGNSEASIPLIFALLPSLLIFILFVSSGTVISTPDCGKLFTKSVSSLAGTVVDPSS